MKLFKVISLIKWLNFKLSPIFHGMQPVYSILTGKRCVCKQKQPLPERPNMPPPPRTHARRLDGRSNYELKFEWEISKLSPDILYICVYNDNP